jgi:hypothetical protein
MPQPDGRRLAADVLLGIVVPLGLAHVPPLVERVPSLGVLRGPAGLVLVGVGAVVLLARLLAGRWAGWAARLAAKPLLLFAAAAVLYAAVGLYYAAGVQVSGDEPHYLVMAQSLWRDHDLELRDEYDGEEWSEFVPGPLRPHWGAPRADGRPYPAHSPGLPLLLAPTYALGGRPGSVVLMALIAAAAAAVCRDWRSARRGTRARASPPGWPPPEPHSSSIPFTSTRRRRRPSPPPARSRSCWARRHGRQPSVPRSALRRCRGCTSR